MIKSVCLIVTGLIYITSNNKLEMFLHSSTIELSPVNLSINQFKPTLRHFFIFLDKMTLVKHNQSKICVGL